MNQIERIVEVTGMPSRPDIESVASAYAGTMLESLPPTQTKNLTELFPSATAECRDFIRSLILFNPDRIPIKHYDMYLLQNFTMRKKNQCIPMVVSSYQLMIILN